MRPVWPMMCRSVPFPLRKALSAMASAVSAVSAASAPMALATLAAVPAGGAFAASPVPAGQGSTPERGAPPSLAPGWDAPGDFYSRDFIRAERSELLQQASLDRPHSSWFGLSALGGVYDSHLEMLLPRAGFAVKGGYRYETFGVLGQVEYDSFWDVGQEITRTSALSTGVGVEVTHLGGRARSSWVGGLTYLLTSTVLHDRGEIGAYVDVMPIGVRFPLGGWGAFEIAPLHMVSHTFRTSSPVFGIYQFVTSFSMEIFP